MSVVGPDPGPAARLEALKLDEGAPSVIFQRLTGEKPETLRDIAKAWQLPKGRFTEWFTTQHADLYDTALKVRAADLAIDAMQAALDATPETVGVAKLQADVALKLASKFDRARYGETVRVEKSVSFSADAGLLGTAGELLRLAAVRSLPRLEKIIESPSTEIAGAGIASAGVAPPDPDESRPLVLI